MRKVTNNQRGIAHLGLLIVAVFVFGAVGFAGVNVYKNNQPDQLSSATSDAHVLGTKDNKKTANKKFKRLKTPANGTIQYYVKEKVTNEKGKTTYIGRGNVAVTLTAGSGTSQRCRDAGKIFVKDGNVVFSGKTDADKSHKKNLGKIRIDSCTPGDYVATATLSDSYEAVGVISKKVRIVNAHPIKVTFVIKKKGTDSTPASAKAQDTSTLPAVPPKQSAVIPLTQKAEKAALDQTNLFENDMFATFKTCVAEDDLGDILSARKDNFATHSSKYMTPALIGKVTTQYAGDAFPLLGVTDLKCNFYKQISLSESKPLASAGDGTTATVEHTVKAISRNPTIDKSPAKPDVVRVWTYNLVRSGDNWQISSIEVK